MGQDWILKVSNAGIYYRRKAQGRILGNILAGKSAYKWALRDISFECYENDIIGIIGHNGAGKSTLCMLLSGILQPDEGLLETVYKVTPILSLGAGLSRELSGRDNIYLYAALLNIPKLKVDALFDEIVAFSELGDYIEEPIKYYSSGMKSRLSFSVASILEPEILILDEVFAAGDKFFREKSKERILKTMGSCKAVFLVSHSTGMVTQLCNRCIWLSDGGIKMIGETKDVIAQYRQAVRK